MSVSVSMIETSNPRANRVWLTICPNRPNPISRTDPPGPVAPRPPTCRRRARAQPVVQHHQERRQDHRDDDDRRQHRIPRGIDQPHGQRGAVKDKGELAPLRHHHRPFQRLGVVGAKEPGERVDHRHLQHHQRHNRHRDQLPVGRDHRQVQRHADGQKEQAQKDAAETVPHPPPADGGRWIRTEEPRPERAHRRRQPADLHPSAAPSTTSRAAAVITSRAPDWASRRNSGFSR